MSLHVHRPFLRRNSETCHAPPVASKELLCEKLTLRTMWSCVNWCSCVPEQASHTRAEKSPDPVAHFKAPLSNTHDQTAPCASRSESKGQADVLIRKNNRFVTQRPLRGTQRQTHVLSTSVRALLGTMTGLGKEHQQALPSNKYTVGQHMPDALFEKVYTAYSIVQPVTGL